MIALTRLDGSHFHLNAALIVTVEAAPDTVVHLQTGTSIMVREHVEQIIESIVAWQRSCMRAVISGPS